MSHTTKLFINVMLWPFIQILTSWIFIKIDSKYFKKNTWIYKRCFFETNYFYLKILWIKKWKKLLPDGSVLFGRGFLKSKISSRSPNYLSQFVIETRRSELSHWAMLCFTPVFFIWNPLWADRIMIAYGLASNLPCIFAQRYNRFKIQNLKCRSEQFRK